MDNLKPPVKDSGDVSSDGEEDFESADEGEGKEKVSSTSQSASIPSKYDINVLRKYQANYETRDVMSDNCEQVHSEKKDLSEGMQNLAIRCDEAKSNESVCETSTLIESSQNILGPSSVDINIGTSSVEDKNNAKARQDTEEEMDKPTDSSNESNLGNEEQRNQTSSQSNESDNGNAESASGGWGWGSWGAVLNQATSTMTSGLSQVIEKVETTLGIPEPGELQDEAIAKDEKNEVITMEPKSAEIDRGVEGSNEETEPDAKGTNSESFFSSWGLTSLSSAVTSKGLELVSEGIDALETIGKKTMDAISEGDPGFRGKREIFKKPTLSQVLREAKEESAKEAAEKKTQEVLEKVNFNDEFDRCQGLAHLEALEILSRECEAKVESVLVDLFEEDLEQAKSQLRAIEDVFSKASQNEEDSDEESVSIEFAVEIGKCAMALNLAFVPNKLNQTEESISKWLEECAKEQEISVSSRSPDDIFAHVITSLANITAKSIEVFRKVAEMLLLMDDKENTVTAEDRSTHLCSLTKVVTNRISSLSTSYAQCLNTAVNETEDNDNITPLITEVYLECSNSSSHVQDSFKLLMPVLQVSALNSLKT